MNIKRLEILLAALDPTVGSEIQKTRPVLVVSNEKNNKFNSVVSILPITSNISFIADFEVFIGRDEKPYSRSSHTECVGRNVMFSVQEAS